MDMREYCHALPINPYAAAVLPGFCLAHNGMPPTRRARPGGGVRPLSAFARLSLILPDTP